MQVFKCMLQFPAKFPSIFHPTCHGCLQKLGGASVYFWTSGEGGVVGSWSDFYRVRGGWHERKKSDFRCPEVGISSLHMSLYTIFLLASGLMSPCLVRETTFSSGYTVLHVFPSFDDKFTHCFGSFSSCTSELHGTHSFLNFLPQHL